MSFRTTRWTLVRTASGAEPERRAALEALCASYWPPVYAFLRRQGSDPARAEDLTQAFFARAFEKDFFAGYDPARGRFRTFLRTCLERFVANEEKAAARLKRGGDTEILHLDFAAAESELRAAGPPPAGTGAPGAAEAAFDAEWTRSLFALAIEALRRECDARGKSLHFRLFSRYDLDDAGADRPTYERLASEFGTTATTVTNHLAWARRELRRLVLETLRSLTGSDEEFRLEARLLLGFEPGTVPDGDASGETSC